MTRLSVFSEIDRLRAVAVHCPGLEVDNMTPALMHELLFDDILFGDQARAEHETFAGVLAKTTDQVLDVQDLLVEALTQPGARAHFLTRFCALFKLDEGEREQLASMDAKLLALYAIAGWYEERDNGTKYRFRLAPSPNLLFMRDAAAVIGNGVSINNMKTKARRAEPFLLDVILRFHPDFRVDHDQDVWFNAIPDYLEGDPRAHYTIEGGDILVLSEDILAIGVSERTTQGAVTMLAERLSHASAFKTVFVVLMPAERSVMHLDTIFTQIDQEHCLIYPPLLAPDHAHTVPVVRMDITGPEIKISLKDSFIKALAEDGHELKPIPCGGAKRLDQEREQWTDGANAFCLAPGVILGYNRNVRTAEELDRAGYVVLDAEEALSPDVDLLDGKRYLIQVRGNELSRARGGPRCMTMPLRRDRF